MLHYIEVQIVSTEAWPPQLLQTQVRVRISWNSADALCLIACFGLSDFAVQQYLNAWIQKI